MPSSRRRPSPASKDGILMIASEKWFVRQAPLLLFVALIMLLRPMLPAHAAVIKDLRLGSKESYARMVLEFDRPLTPAPSFSIDGNRLQVDLLGIENDMPTLHPDTFGDDIVSIYVYTVSAARRIKVIFSFAPAHVKTFFLTEPDRFIIDAFRPVPTSAADPPNDTGLERQVMGEDSPKVAPPPDTQALAAPAAGSATRKDEAPVEVNGSVTIRPHTADESKQNRLHQRRIQHVLIAALIVTTSIIAVLLILLIWIDRGRKIPTGEAEN